MLNAAGCTGRPNVDWCEDNKEATIRSNVIGSLNLTDCCYLKGIHCTVFATGCIYEYDEKHKIGGEGFREEEEANFAGSFYSATKSKVEEVELSCANEGVWVLMRNLVNLDNEDISKCSYFEAPHASIG